ncbi:hypothetical protein GCM10020227_53090 [Streptomyces flavovirens]
MGETSDSGGGGTDPGTDPGPEQPADAACAVTYAITNQWPGGFQADVTVTNTGDAAYDGWKLGWSFPGGQQISQIWNASHRQDGVKVTVTDAGWNGTVAPGSSAGFGFTGSWTGSNAEPAAFTLDGQACTVG